VAIGLGIAGYFLSPTEPTFWLLAVFPVGLLGLLWLCRTYAWAL
jgi:hypothetical protein